MLRFIGLTGAAGAGKDTAALWFVQWNPHMRMAQFAMPLKQMVRGLLQDVGIGPSGQYWYTNDPEGKQTPIPELNGRTTRHLMQTLGTEWGRQTQGEDFWLEIAARRINRTLAMKRLRDTDGLVFTDVRFPNEAELIRAAGGKIVRITRPGHENPPDVAAHASESTPVPFDIEIINDSDIPTLHARLAEHFPPIPKKVDKHKTKRKT